MAATIAAVTGASSGLAQPIVPGSTYALQFTLTGDSSYTTGGYAFGITQVQAACGQGMAIQYVLVMSPTALVGDAVGTPATTAYIAGYDYLNSKVQLFDTGSGSGAVLAETASTTNVATVVVRLLVFFR